MNDNVSINIALDTKEKIARFHEIYATKKYERMTRESKHKLMELGEEKYREFIKTLPRTVELVLEKLNEAEIVKLHQLEPTFNNYNGKNTIILEKAELYSIIRIYGLTRIDDEMLIILKPFILGYKRVVIYSMAKSNYMNQNRFFDFCPSVFGWMLFAGNIEELAFEGGFEKKQFSSVHIKALVNTKYLKIGTMNYTFLEEEINLEELPRFNALSIGTCGTVCLGKTGMKWMNLLRLNGECVVHGSFCEADMK